MALPAGILTREVTFGPFMSFEGKTLTGSVKFVPSRSLIWLANGTPVMSKTITVPLDEDGRGYVYLPCTDQNGFGDGRGNSVLHWTYRAVITLNTEQQPKPVVFSVPLAADSIDLDMVSPQSISAPTIAALPIVHFLVLGGGEALPPGTPPNTVIVRKS